MKNIFSVLKIALVLPLIFAVSCTQEEKPEIVPTVSLEIVEADMTSITFNVTSTDAAELAYVRLNDLNQVPSANAILAAGVKLSVPSQEVVLSDLTPGQVYYVAAAAVSEEGKYSEVQTLELSTTGENCTFELTISGATQESLLYSVKPSNAATKFYAAALLAADYGDASDEDIQAAVVESINALATAEGVSLQDYLADALMMGEQTNNTISGLAIDTEYVVVVYGMSEEDATPTTGMAKAEGKTLAEVPELTFTLTATEITTSTAHVTVTPSDMEATYVWLCQAASSYPGLTADDADEIAETYVENQGMWLEQGIGLYTGSYDIPDFDVMSDTDYYLFAFGYTPGIGITSSCELITFHTDRGYPAEDFMAEIIIDSYTARRVVSHIVPDANFEGIYYGCTIIPTAKYSEQAAEDSITTAITAYYDLQIEYNPGYTMEDAVSSVCTHGSSWFEPSGLTPDTEYTIAVVAVTNQGEPAKVITATCSTTPEIVADVEFNNEFVAIYDGYEALEAGLFTDQASAVEEMGIAVFKFERVGDPAECYYYLANGDYSDPEEEWKTDDDLLSWITTNPYFYSMEEGEEYAFVIVDYYDAYTMLGWDMTMLSVAKDDAGTWSSICRTLFRPEYAKRGDIQELVDLINEIEAGTESLSIKASK